MNTTSLLPVAFRRLIVCLYRPVTSDCRILQVFNGGACGLGEKLIR